VPSYTRNILIGLALGSLGGLFLGEKTEVFQFAVRAYLGLLQMTVLRYVMVSLIGGIGRLGFRDAMRGPDNRVGR